MLRENKLRTLTERGQLDMAARNMQEMDVILRFQSDVKNGHNFFTDQNGYQLIGRETRTGEKIKAIQFLHHAGFRGRV